VVMVHTKPLSSYLLGRTEYVYIQDQKSGISRPLFESETHRVANFSHEASTWEQLFVTDPTEYVSPSPHLRAETDPVSEKPGSLEYRTLDKVQKPNNPESQSQYHQNG
jgi:hypothetical protein